jgi:transposase-like protein
MTDVKTAIHKIMGKDKSKNYKLGKYDRKDNYFKCDECKKRYNIEEQSPVEKICDRCFLGIRHR